MKSKIVITSLAELWLLVDTGAEIMKMVGVFGKRDTYGYEVCDTHNMTRTLLMSLIGDKRLVTPTSGREDKPEFAGTISDRAQDKWPSAGAQGTNSNRNTPFPAPDKTHVNLLIQDHRLGFFVRIVETGAEQRVESGYVEGDAVTEHHRGHDLKLATYIACRVLFDVTGMGDLS
jgi:hypothetical protein